MHHRDFFVYYLKIFYEDKFEDDHYSLHTQNQILKVLCVNS